MKTEKLKQFAFVEAYDLDAFEVKLNEKLEDLMGYEAEVTFCDGDRLMARIAYVKKIRAEEETPAERGILFSCGQCPRFEHILKKNGTPDLRRVYGNCEFGEMGRVWKTQPACSYLYKMIADGRIRLALEDEEVNNG